MATKRGVLDIKGLSKKAEDGSLVASRFIKSLNSSILEKKDPYTPSPYFNPSSLICSRQMYYKAKKKIPYSKPSIELVGILESGEDRHERIQQTISKMTDFEYLDVEEYVSANNIKGVTVIKKDGMETLCIIEDLDLKFKTDGILKHNNQYYIFEFKTEVSYKFQKREKQEPSHETQAACYALAFEIEDVLFVYEDRNVCSKKAYLFHVTDKNKQEIVEKIKRVQLAVKKGIVPPQVANEQIDKMYKEHHYAGTSRKKPKDKICQYCNYRKDCERDGE